MCPSQFDIDSARRWLVHWPPVIPLLVSLMLGASAAVYAMLARRWTTWPRREDLRHWSWRNGMRLREGWRARRPRALDAFGPYRTIVSLHDRRTTVLRVECPPAHRPPAPPAVWNIAVHRLRDDWPTACARPATRRACLFDRLLVDGMYATWSSDGRPMHGRLCLPTRAMKHSGACELLPGDVAILLHGPWLMLDFSSRPFDELEVGRMRLLVERVAQCLPAVPKEA